MTSEFEIYLTPGPCIDSDHPSIVALAERLTDSGASQRENAIALYYWVRDEIRYNPYGLGLTLEARPSFRCGHLGRQNLQRRLTTELRVLGDINLTHAAPADLLADLVVVQSTVHQRA